MWNEHHCNGLFSFPTFAKVFQLYDELAKGYKDIWNTRGKLS